MPPLAKKNDIENKLLTGEIQFFTLDHSYGTQGPPNPLVSSEFQLNVKSDSGALAVYMLATSSS